MNVHITPDVSEIESQLCHVKSLLERLPENVGNPLRERFSNLVDFGLKTELVPTPGTSCYVLRFRSVALTELCVATLRAVNGCGA